VRLYTESDAARFFDDEHLKESESFRSPYRRDYARLIHCPAFRRLQGKTQVFPGNESDFYRNRLTHSLEVAQIAKAIAIRLNATENEFSAERMKIDPDIVEFAGLAHDLGHPPFGHNGEEALDECMRDHGGFEGNAQTLRIISRLEKKTTLPRSEGDIVAFDREWNDLRCGLNVTYRSLAALLKYDRCIPERAADRPEPGVMKGFYACDAGLVRKVKEHVLGSADPQTELKTLECSIMDIADDIAYSTYDLEDNFKAGFLTPLGLFALDDEVYEATATTIKKRAEKQYPERSDFFNQIDTDLVKGLLHEIFEELLFNVGPETVEIIRSKEIERSKKKMLVVSQVQALSRKLASDGYHRVAFTSRLIQTFLNGVEVVNHDSYPQLVRIRLQFDTFLYVEVLKNITYYAIIRSPALQVVEYRGKDIIKSIFEAIQADGTRLLPEDFRALCQGAPEMIRMRTICDFIAGMTDRYAFEFYGRLFGTSHLTMHKPL
jgi:dGTPase